jgi:hypothetical protein
MAWPWHDIPAYHFEIYQSDNQITSQMKILFFEVFVIARVMLAACWVSSLYLFVGFGLGWCDDCLKMR